MSEQKEEQKPKLIGEVHGYKVYMSPECQESLDKLDLSEEEKKKLISESLDKIAGTIRKEGKDRE